MYIVVYSLLIQAIQRMDRALRALAEGWTPPPPFSDGRCY